MSGLLVTFAPSTVGAATITTVPTRLYMAPAGVSIPNGIAQLVGVKVGTLEFDGSTDPISQDVRSIVVNTVTGAQGCDLTAPPYSIDDCSRVQIGPISHGRLKAGTIETIDDGDGNPATTGTGDDVYLLSSGARIDNSYQVAKGSYSLGINGTPEDLNQALAALVCTPDLGYYYEGSNDENVNIVVVPGNADDNLTQLPPAGQAIVTTLLDGIHAIQREVNPKNGDPEVAGIATADVDFQGTYNNTLIVPENEEFIPTAGVFPDPPNTTIYPDIDVEGNRGREHSCGGRQ